MEQEDLYCFCWKEDRTWVRCCDVDEDEVEWVICDGHHRKGKKRKTCPSRGSVCRRWFENNNPQAVWDSLTVDNDLPWYCCQACKMSAPPSFLLNKYKQFYAKARQ
jgi:hypothetical protein